MILVSFGCLNSVRRRSATSAVSVWVRETFGIRAIFFLSKFCPKTVCDSGSITLGRGNLNYSCFFCSSKFFRRTLCDFGSFSLLQDDGSRGGFPGTLIRDLGGIIWGPAIHNFCIQLTTKNEHPENSPQTLFRSCRGTGDSNFPEYFGAFILAPPGYVLCKHKLRI